MLKDVQGQTEGVRVLTRVIEGGLDSPLLLLGPEGVGRRFSVVEAAKEFFSKGNPDSPHCKRISKGAHPDLIRVRAEEGKELGIEPIRQVLSIVDNFPTMVPTRFVLVEGVDTMTVPAANAFLKILEEKPVTTRFFLLAETESRVIATIRSRCGIVRYRPLPESFVFSLIKPLTNDPTKALVCTRLGEGSVGLAHQILVSGRLILRDKVLDVLKYGLRKDFSSLFLTVDEMKEEIGYFIRFLDHLLTDLVMFPYDSNSVTNLDILEKLGLIREKLGGSKIDLLISGLRDLQGTFIHKPVPTFHLKSYLVSSFIG